MNHGVIIGGVTQGAENAYTAQGVRHVQFSIVARDSRGEESYWKCDADAAGRLQPEVLDVLLARAVPGAGIRVHYELASRPFVKNGVHLSDVKFLRVTGVAFPPARPARAQTVGAEA